jgi:hypothetical protein
MIQYQAYRQSIRSLNKRFKTSLAMDADFVPLGGNDKEWDRFDYGDRETAEQIAIHQPIPTPSPPRPHLLH